MTNTDAAWVLEEYIRTAKPCNGLKTALEMAVLALNHSPDVSKVLAHVQARQEQPVCTTEEAETVLFSDPEISGYRCSDCQFETPHTHFILCPNCGSHELKPVYKASDIGQVTP